eukprot:5104043-Pyramimonas_sp.AAC.1
MLQPTCDLFGQSTRSPIAVEPDRFSILAVTPCTLSGTSGTAPPSPSSDAPADAADELELLLLLCSLLLVLSLSLSPLSDLPGLSCTSAPGESAGAGVVDARAKLCLQQ